MRGNKLAHGYWTCERVKQEALLFSSKAEFRKKSNSAYQKAHRLGIIEEVTGHMQSNFKPRGFWDNKDNCMKEASNYKTVSLFIKHSYGAYDAIKRNGWKEEILSQFCSPIKPMGYWDYAHCKEVASKCHSRSAFMRDYPGAYAAVIKNGWEVEIIKTISVIGKDKGYWDNCENCLEAAANCKTITEFKEKCSGAYQAVIKHDWVDLIYKKMNLPKSKYGVWQNKDICIAEAQKYSNIKDFMKKQPGNYQAIHRNGWKIEAFNHMEVVGSRIKRSIYLVCFDLEKKVYVGLSYNPERRLKQHIEFKEGKAIGSNPGMRKLLDDGSNAVLHVLTDFFSEEIAKKLEYSISKSIDTGVFDEDLREKLTKDGMEHLEFVISNHYQILNKYATGAMGGTIKKWTKAAVIERAKTMQHISELYGLSGMYHAARKGGYLEDIKSMIQYKRVNLSKDKCRKVASYYYDIALFRQNEPSVYSKIHKKGWNELMGHMLRKKKSNGFWTLDKCLDEAKKYNSIKEFSLKSSGAYDAIIREGWIGKLREILHSKRRIFGHYNNFENCLIEAKKYVAVTSFEKGSPGAYRSAFNHGWLKEITSHMKRPYKGEK